MNGERTRGDPLTVLLVEDNLSHAELVMSSFEEDRVADRIHHVADGEAALDYLFQRGRYAYPVMSPRPDVTLLDLRLPGMDGLEVLKEIKAREELQRIPVIVLTTSDAERDVAMAYDYHANSYLVKPVNIARFTQQMDELGSYWLGWNRSPWR